MIPEYRTIEDYLRLLSAEQRAKLRHKVIEAKARAALTARLALLDELKNKGIIGEESAKIK